MSQEPASTGALRRPLPSLRAIDMPISHAVLMVLSYPVIHLVLTLTMLLTAKRSSQIQGFNFTTAEVIDATHPLAMPLGLILAGLLVGSWYFGSRNMGVFFRSLVREYLDASLGMHLAAAAIGSLLPAGYLVLLALLSGGEARRAPSDILGGTGGLAYWIVSLIVLTPVVEEILFRGILFRALAKRFGSVVFILASTITFTASHFISIATDWRVSVSICLQGLIASTLYAWGQRLGPCITLHAAYNTVVVLWVTSALAF